MCEQIFLTCSLFGENEFAYNGFLMMVLMKKEKWIITLNRDSKEHDRDYGELEDVPVIKTKV